MRIVALGATMVARTGRLRAALASLGARGHDVMWVGPAAPVGEGVRRVRAREAITSGPVDLVAGEGSLLRTAWLAVRTRARGVIFGAGARHLHGWNLAQEIAWGAVPTYALIEPAEAADAEAKVDARHHDRIVLWPDGSGTHDPDPAHADAEVLERAGERLLAERRGPRPWPAAFLDRDGTLIVEHGYLADPDRVQLLPGVVRGLRQLQSAHVALVVISNQAGVGRGKFPLSAAWATMARLRRLLRAEGVELDAVRFCPHAPDAGCPCRKPAPGLLLDAALDLNLSLPGSAMVGDKALDVDAGHAAGSSGVLVRTGYGREEEVRLARDGAPPPEAVVDDLEAFAAWAIGRLEAL